MRYDNKAKSAMAIVELVVGVLLVTVVIFIVLGLFGDNLKTMFASGHFKNIYEGEEDRTRFSSWSKNYSGSQIDVMVVGEQGLDQLRMKANNSSDDIIENLGLNTKSTTIGNTIAYLNSIINLIVGDPAVCMPMNKESSYKCGTQNVPATKYNVTISSNAIVITSADNTEPERKIIPDKGESFKVVNTYNSSPGGNPWQQIQYVQYTYNGYINVAQSLARDVKKFNNELPDLIQQGELAKKSEFAQKLTSLLDTLNTRVTITANDACICTWTNCEIGRVYGSSCNPGVGDYRSKFTDILVYNAPNGEKGWKTQIQSAVYSKDMTLEGMMNIILNSSNLGYVIDTIKKDEINGYNLEDVPDDGLGTSYDYFFRTLYNLAVESELVGTPSRIKNLCMANGTCHL